MSDHEIVIEGEIEMGTALEIPTGQASAVMSGPVDAMGLLVKAMEMGVTVEMMGQLMELQERAERRSAVASFIQAKTAFQMECPEIRKAKTAEIATKSGARFSYTYAPLEVITRTILPVLAKHGLTYSWGNAEYTAQGKILIVPCVLRHVAGHEEVSSFPVPVDQGGRMSDAQAMGGALTYGRRQSLIAVLGLTTADEDTDAAKREPKSVSKATREDVANIDALIDEVGANREKFLEVMRVKDLAEMPASDVPKAIALLERKRRAQ